MDNKDEIINHLGEGAQEWTGSQQELEQLALSQGVNVNTMQTQGRIFFIGTKSLESDQVKDI